MKHAKAGDPAQPGADTAARRYGKGSAMREKILADTVRRYCSDAAAPVSLRALSRELGIEAAHVLYYFGTFEHLLECVLNRWDEEAAGIAVPGDGALAVLSRYVASVRRNLTAPGVVRLYFQFASDALEPGHPAHAYFTARFEGIRRELCDALKRGQQAGVIAPHVDADYAAQSLIALSDGLQFQALLGGAVDAAEHLDRAVRQLLVRPGHDQSAAAEIHRTKL
ncbi:TetR family transcriptional regulator [Sphingomonas sp. LH128]|nr:TetR family transcriptional regulator C-terminal domain-containing protein [Sphingomonas sp. LH128]EJU10933.1 TetR family transcriptional regulator [Sphingomonas sp. LH128]